MPLFCCWQLDVDTTVNLPITILRFQKYLDHLFTCDCHLSHICVNEVALSTAKSDIQASNKEIFCNFKQYNNDDDVTVMVTNSLGQFSYCLAASGSSTQALSSDPENNDNLGRVKVLEENVTKVHEALVRKKSYSQFKSQRWVALMLQPSAVYLPQKHKTSSKLTLYHERKKTQRLSGI